MSSTSTLKPSWFRELWNNYLLPAHHPPFVSFSWYVKFRLGKEKKKKETTVLVHFDLLSVFVFQGTDTYQWPPHPGISRHVSRDCQFLPSLACVKSNIWSSSCTCRSTGYSVLSFHVSSRSFLTSLFFVLHAFFNVCIKQLAVWEVNESGNSCCFLLVVCDKAADFCCIHKQTIQMSRLCLSSQEQCYWNTVDFNDNRSFQDKFPRPVRFAAILFCWDWFYIWVSP